MSSIEDNNIGNAEESEILENLEFLMNFELVEAEGDWGAIADINSPTEDIDNEDK